MSDKRSCIHFSQEMAVNVCMHKGKHDTIHIDKRIVLKSRYSATTLNEITGTNSMAQPAFSTFQDKLL